MRVTSKDEPCACFPTWLKEASTDCNKGRCCQCRLTLDGHFVKAGFSLFVPCARVADRVHGMTLLAHINCLDDWDKTWKSTTRHRLYDRHPAILNHISPLEMQALVDACKANHKLLSGRCNNCNTHGQEQCHLLRCSACNSAIYCDAACQKAHRSEHKPLCRQIVAARQKVPEEAKE